MAYLDRSPRNWGALLATTLAVPGVLVWLLIALVGGTLACEGVDGPCGPSIVSLLGGLAVIVAACAAIGWSLNRLIHWFSCTH